MLLAKSIDLDNEELLTFLAGVLDSPNGTSGRLTEAVDYCIIDVGEENLFTFR